DGGGRWGVHDKRCDGCGDVQCVAGLRDEGELQLQREGLRCVGGVQHPGGDADGDGRGAGDYVGDDGDGGGGDAGDDGGVHGGGGGSGWGCGDVLAGGCGRGRVHDQRCDGGGEVQREPGLRDEELVLDRREGLGCLWGGEHADGDDWRDGRGADDQLWECGERGGGDLDGDGGVHGGGDGCERGRGDVRADGGGRWGVHDKR